MLITESLCTGCGTCLNVCHVNAIRMVASEKGFMYPKVDDSLCVNCKQCIRKCPINLQNTAETFDQKVYAAWSKDKNVRKISSSGGLFSLLADFTLQQGGAVCASSFNDDFTAVEFGICERKTDVPRYRGSKYLQSSTGTIYQQVKDILTEGRKLLFIGTGCQVAGLKSFLGRDFDNLLCIDLVCHGTPSPLVWKNYVNYLDLLHGSSGVESVTFRKKKPSWKVYSISIKFKNGKQYEASKTEDPYMIAFAKDYMLRPSCEHCKFACKSREGDITLADFWSYRSFDFRTRNDEKGISCVIINSDKGNRVFEAIRNQLTVVEKTMEEAIRGNRSLVSPWPANEKAAEFWKSYIQNGNDALLQFCKPYKTSKKMMLDWFIQDHLWMIPKPILFKLLKRNR